MIIIVIIIIVIIVIIIIHAPGTNSPVTSSVQEQNDPEPPTSPFAFTAIMPTKNMFALPTRAATSRIT